MDRERSLVGYSPWVAMSWMGLSNRACLLFITEHLVGIKVRRAYMFPLRCVAQSPDVKLYPVEKVSDGGGGGDDSLLLTLGLTV